MFPDLSTRAHDPEIIDLEEPPFADIDRMHTELSIINRALGGVRASMAAVTARLPAHAQGRVLDLGAGGGDFPRALLRWGRRRRRRVRIVSCDISPVACRNLVTRLHGETGPSVVQADGRQLPLGEGSVDVAHAALFLHHFPAETAITLLREMARVARYGVVINDLERHAAAYLGIRALTGAFSRSRLIRNDAPLSVRKGFTRPELEALARGAGLRAEIDRRWAFRYVLWAPTGRTT